MVRKNEVEHLNYHLSAMITCRVNLVLRDGLSLGDTSSIFFNVAIVKSEQIFNKNIGSVAQTAISVEETHNI